jgi:hypothetical protein
MMTRGEWVRGQSAHDLAAEWECSVALVERYSTEASRFLRLIREPEAIRAKVLARLTEIGDQDQGDRVPALLGAARMAGVLDLVQSAHGPTETLHGDKNTDVAAILADPPAELLDLLLTVWLEPALAAGTPDVVVMLAAHGWQRGPTE